MTELMRPYRGVSATDRQQARRAALIEASLDIVATEGVAGITVEAVCAAARLTKRYFYESFADRDALLAATSDQMFTELWTTISTALGDSGSPDPRAAVQALVTALTDDPRFARLYVESPSHPGLRAHREQAVRDFTGLIADSALPFEGDPVPGTDRTLATRLIVAGTTELVTAWLAGDLDTDAVTLVETIVAVGAGSAAVV
ncbi:MAG: TetR/AcrR family transcriptional regulator [Marmoricola sp.]